MWAERSLFRRFNMIKIRLFAIKHVYKNQRLSIWESSREACERSVFA